MARMASASIRYHRAVRTFTSDRAGSEQFMYMVRLVLVFSTETVTLESASRPST